MTHTVFHNCLSCRVHYCNDQSCYIIRCNSNAYYFIYSLSFFTIEGYICELATWPVPSWLYSSIGRSLVEHCTGIAEVLDSKPAFKPDFFFRLQLHQCLSCVCSYDDQSRLYSVVLLSFSILLFVVFHILSRMERNLRMQVGSPPDHCASDWQYLVDAYDTL